MKAHVTGIFNPPGDFDHKSCWNSMKHFYQCLGWLPEVCWVQVLSFEDGVEMAFGADESLLSAYCMDFYVPSSPTKA
jgi:hypothetical protein